MKCRVEFTARVDRAVDAESTRYALAGVQVTPDPEGGVFCAATNSRILTITRQAGEADQTCLLPGSLVAGKAGERDATVEYDEATDAWTRTAMVKGSKVIRTEPFVEGRFPRVNEVLPDFSSGPILSLSIDPRFLLHAAEAMGCNDEVRAITLLVSLPRSENLLPSSAEVVAAIRRLIGSDAMALSMAAQKLWALAVNDDGSWEVGRFTDRNRLDADWHGKWDVIVNYRPVEASFEPTVCAGALLTQARATFAKIGLNIEEPIGLVNGKQNIGVIMPWAGDKPSDKLAEYSSTRLAYIASLTGKEMARKPLVAPSSAQEIEPAAICDVDPSTAEPVSIDALQAQLTALLAQCA